MNKRIDDYRIIYGVSFNDLSNEVINFINSNDGYELCGGICVIHLERSNAQRYYQAVVKFQN